MLMVEKEEFEYLDMPTRTFNLFGDCNEKSCENFLNFIYDIEQFDSLYQKAYPDEELLPVIININSFGGLLNSCLAMVDALMSLDAPVVARAYGACMSSAFVIFCSCDIRQAGEHTQFMYHTMLYDMPHSALESHRKTLKHSDYLQKRLNDLVKRDTNLTDEELLAHIEEDWMISYEDALKYGIVNCGESLNHFVNNIKK